MKHKEEINHLYRLIVYRTDLTHREKILTLYLSGERIENVKGVILECLSGWSGIENLLSSRFSKIRKGFHENQFTGEVALQFPKQKITLIYEIITIKISPLDAFNPASYMTYKVNSIRKAASQIMQDEEFDQAVSNEDKP